MRRNVRSPNSARKARRAESPNCLEVIGSLHIEDLGLKPDVVRSFQSPTTSAHGIGDPGMPLQAYLPQASQVAACAPLSYISDQAAPLRVPNPSKDAHPLLTTSIMSMSAASASIQEEAEEVDEPDDDLLLMDLPDDQECFSAISPSPHSPGRRSNIDDAFL